MNYAMSLAMLEYQEQEVRRTMRANRQRALAREARAAARARSGRRARWYSWAALRRRGPAAAAATS
jgi:hypothetical protein